MRIQNSINNMVFGVSSQLISILMGLVVRTVFIYTLGVEYLGIDGLFTSILLMLSLANLGFDTAMIYSLYKPLAEKDTYKVQALMNLYKKAYRIIGFAVLVIGLMLIPFLPYLINGKIPVDNLHLIYILFLMQSVVSYFFIYKQAIIIADQRNHIISKIHTFFVLLSNIFLIIVLLTIGIYVWVLVTQLVFKIVENIYISKRADSMYSYLKENPKAALTKDERKTFFENLYSLFLYKISGVVINGSDNIIISVFAGIIWVGIYSNYLLIISTVSSLLGYLFYSITASVGNLNVSESRDKNYLIFRVINFSNFWIYGVCSISLFILVNPFITLWIGDEYLLSIPIVFTIILNFYTTGMQNASTTFRETTGLFKKGRYRPLYAAGINIIMSIILVQMIGIMGVFIGTIISRLCVYFWYDPYVIFKYSFSRSSKEYFLRYAVFTLTVVCSGILTVWVSNLVESDQLINLFYKLAVALTLPNLVFFLVFRKSEEFLYLKNVVNLLKDNFYKRRTNVIQIKNY
ncbi:sugar translocase [Jeotgalibacillus sp. ET6]|uniref:lipopolysaccharide biosynthesis protein n=1 Tax=Jeotgalibacillus sp. ET6 TaxID=3037260 RepID=UPI002418996C|nr:sugar translocase [Jeotgalibacillus sp. ET6]MDG5472617.1 sugar translocase [Jeotgalibacillus sp. ET6]